jgi:hypothetical protein
VGIFLFVTLSRPATGPTRPHTQWVPGAFTLGIKWPWREADHLLTPSAEVNSAWSCNSTYVLTVRECDQKFPDWRPGARTANGIVLWHYVQLYRYFVSQSSEFCRHNPLCCFSVFIVVVYFVIDSVRKLLDTSSYSLKCSWPVISITI